MDNSLSSSVEWTTTTSDNTSTLSGNVVYTTYPVSSTGAWITTTIAPTFTSENYKKFKEKLTQILRKQV